MNSAIYGVMKPYLLLETRKFVMAVLHWKQGLLCDKKKHSGHQIVVLKIKYQHLTLIEWLVSMVF